MELFLSRTQISCTRLLPMATRKRKSKSPPPRNRPVASDCHSPIVLKRLERLEENYELLTVKLDEVEAMLPAALPTEEAQVAEDTATVSIKKPR